MFNLNQLVKGLSLIYTGVAVNNGLSITHEMANARM